MDKTSSALVLAVFAAITFFGGIIQAIVAGIELRKHSVQSGKKKRWLTVILIFTVVSVVFACASYYSNTPQVSNNSSAISNPIATATPLLFPTLSPPAQTSSINSASPSAQAQNTQTPSTSLPTASLSDPQLPLKIPCVNCPYPQLTATLNRIDIDSSAQATRWVFSLSNGGQYPCSSLHFFPIQLTDSRGISYEGQGQGARDYQFAIAVGQSIQVNATFGVIPAANTQYLLQAIIYLGGCNIPGSIGTPNTYQTENFTFA